MREALERQCKFVSKVEKRTKAVIPWFFCRPDGVRIYRFYEPWRDACEAAGIQPHTTLAGQQSGTWNLRACHGRLRWRWSVTRRSRSTGATVSSIKRCSKWARRSWKHCNSFSGATAQLWSRCGNGDARPDRTVRSAEMNGMKWPRTLEKTQTVRPDRTVARSQRQAGSRTRRLGRAVSASRS
jgi:hypothetical protein